MKDAQEPVDAEAILREGFEATGEEVAEGANERTLSYHWRFPRVLSKEEERAVRALLAKRAGINPGTPGYVERKTLVDEDQAMFVWAMVPSPLQIPEGETGP